MPLDKLPPEVLLAVASFLPSKDARSLSRTSRKLFSIAEIQLYADVELQIDQSTGESDALHSFYANLMVKQERCAYVRRLSLFFLRTFTGGDLILVLAILDTLPCLHTVLLSHSSLNFSVVDAPVPSRPLAARRTTLKALFRAFRAAISRRHIATPPPFSYTPNGLPQQQSPRLDLIWSNRTPFNGPGFLSFVSLHSNIRVLSLPRCLKRNFPKLDASVLPNLESVYAHFTVVLALLPGRKIQRVKSFGGPKDHWKRLKDASGRTFNGDGLDNIKVLSCQPDWIAVAEFPVFLLRKMRDLEVLDLSDGHTYDIAALRHANLQFLRLGESWSRREAFNLFNLFKSMTTLKCIEWTDDTVYRLRRDARLDTNVVWRCAPRDVWLADWEKDSYEV
ncbi:hypothetical protein EYR40_007405 [Pleurotus pulmonarius]|nr:hypothetical protein EYR36_008241 [Pleurotus pulmonarius]KAF4579997.1 hypothetical protein EYR36_001817 [Pleurotus pulmonarius]KAF4596955.1 hypothetical protein EYR40_007405 [Pleurotus pulmonarius]